MLPRGNTSWPPLRKLSVRYYLTRTRLAELQRRIGEAELAIERMALIRTALEEKTAELREREQVARDRAAVEDGKQAANAIHAQLVSAEAVPA